MELNEDVQVFNYLEGLKEEYRINYNEEITKDNILPLSVIESDDKITTGSTLRNDFIILLSFKVKNKIDLNNSNVNEITLIGFVITIISNNKKNQKVDINIPIKEKNITKKSFSNQNFFFYDFITINETKSYLLVYIFSQLNIFKVYQKDDNLKYIKVKMKNFDNNNKKFKTMYLGSNLEKNKNILIIKLILKPENIFLFIPIDTSDKNEKLEVKQYSIDSKKYNNILSKFKRSYTDKFLFIEKETNKKYLIYPNDKNNEMIVKELEMNIWENKNLLGNEFSYLYNIEGKMYVISEIPKEKDNEENYINIGISSVIYNMDKDKYELQLIQKIKIKDDGGEKDFKFNLSNCFSVNIGEKLFFIQLDQKGCVNAINQFQLNTKNLEISRKNSEKWNENSSFIFYIKNEIFLSNFKDNFEKLGKCIIEYRKEEKIIEGKIEEKENKKNNECLKDNKKGNKQKIEEKIILEKYIIDKEDRDEMKIQIQEIVDQRIQNNMKRIEKLKNENEKRYKMFEKILKDQNEENKKIEQKCNILAQRIKKLSQKMGACCEENVEEEDENEMNVNYFKNNNNYSNNYNNNQYHDYKKSKNQNKTNARNNLQILNFRQVNPQQQIMNQFNNLNTNELYNKKININDPIIIQLLQQQQQQQLQQRNMMIQGNLFFQK